ncbi:ChbG/HpnK family deacetylase [Candidatus Methylopumilus turicensis]|uniref:YdjC family protein n=1 Tax=Candidatus Methylopumilus turicensis TaxID=1581680 RepID=A0A0B7IXW9_9PROT|nr:ChbG/HpnK family deacetylase [Candidatus Methylopumilus turicensis]CEN55953.1 YdjC family protein [Candidatus Methylopumilus turicensis]
MRVILCADDFAQSEAIDRAIIALIEKGRLSATSCMTLSPRWKEASKQLTPTIRAKASIGLHLDFTHFSRSTSHAQLVLLSIMHQLSFEHIKVNINQQLDAFEMAMGSAPDYVDGHQHVHQLPMIREALLEVLSTRYPKKLPWLRIAKPPIRDGIKGIIIRALGANTLERKAKKLGFVCSGSLLGSYGFKGTTETYSKRLQSWISTLNDNQSTPVLMCHPAINEMLSTDDPIYAARTTEYQALNSDAIAQAFESLELVKSPSY